MSSDHPMKPVVDGWLGKIRRAHDLRKPWVSAADDCQAFYNSATGFMWKDSYKNKFLRDDSGYTAPKFQLSLNRIFEAVAIMGPSLYWRVPQRTATPKKLFELDPELMEFAQVDPQFAQLLQMAQAEEQQTMPLRRLRAMLMQKLLNWSAGECKLAMSGQMATTDALLTGRGCLWVGPYNPPGSDQTIVSSWWDNPRNLYIDPDSTSPQFDDAWWICQRVVEPLWKIERDREQWGIKPGSLKKYGTYTSANAQGEMYGDIGDEDNPDKQQSRSQDLGVYYKIHSRCGVGARLTDVDWKLKDVLDKTLGDRCYVEVMPNVPYLLNCPSHVMANATDDELRERFEWPCPALWRDRRWPVTTLDFYPDPTSPYPVGPFAPGMGELKAMNFFFAHSIEHVHTSMRTFIAVLQSASEEIKRSIAKGGDLTYLELQESAHKSIAEVVQFLQQPNMITDVWMIQDRLAQAWDRRVGVSDISFGQQGESQSRSATDVKIRQGNLSVRPEYMASKVAEFNAEVAKAEAIASRWWYRSEQVVAPLGRTGAYLYKTLIEDQPLEATLQEIDYAIDANSGRRPNKDKDNENSQALMQMMAPVADKHADATGDTGPLNELIRLQGKAMETDVSKLQFSERIPLMLKMQMQQQQQAAQDPNAQAMQQAQQQAQMGGMQAQAQMQQAAVVEAQAKAQQQVQKLQAEAQATDMELRNLAVKNDQEMLKKAVIAERKKLIKRGKPSASR